jgi:hypothetical protein
MINYLRAETNNNYNFILRNKTMINNTNNNTYKNIVVNSNSNKISNLKKNQIQIKYQI